MASMKEVTKVRASLAADAIARESLAAATGFEERCKSHLSDKMGGYVYRSQT